MIRMMIIMMRINSNNKKGEKETSERLHLYKHDGAHLPGARVGL